MTSAIRSYTHFSDFGGEISGDMYMFPKLYTITAKQQHKEWAVYVRLIKADSKVEGKKHNWSLVGSHTVPIKPEYLADDAELPNGTISEVWTETGIVGRKISRYPPTYPAVTNKGRANERNPLHQGLVMARSKFLKKREGGFMEDIGDFDNMVDRKFFVMLAQKYEDHASNIKYPVNVQPKLDGVRWVIYLDLLGESLAVASIANVVIYSRQKKEYPHNEHNDGIRGALLRTLVDRYDEKHQESIYLDGELYMHGMSLQRINSIGKSSKSKHCENLRFNIFDMFYPHYTDQPFTDRYATLVDIDDDLTKEEQRHIAIVDTRHAANEKEETELYFYFIEQGYEGTIVRSPGARYMKDNSRNNRDLRSKFLLKRKAVFDAEFEVVDFTTGKEGRDIGAVIWICAIDGKRFNVTPNEPYEVRYRQYAECTRPGGDGFDEMYAGRMLTVEYRGLSDDGIPQHAKGIAFRDDV